MKTGITSDGIVTRDQIAASIRQIRKHRADRTTVVGFSLRISDYCDAVRAREIAISAEPCALLESRKAKVPLLLNAF